VFAACYTPLCPTDIENKYFQKINEKLFYPKFIFAPRRPWRGKFIVNYKGGLSPAINVK
jgi:hypothetical protein